MSGAKQRRGGGTGGGASGGLSQGSIIKTSEMISTRDEGKRPEVDQVLKVLKDVRDTYGVTVTEAQIASIRGRASNGVIAYYDIDGNLAVNKKFFDTAKLDAAYDDCVKEGFHPKRGKKTGIEAVVAHELGHRLTDVAAQKRGYGKWQLERVAGEIIDMAMKNTRHKDRASFAKRISGYAESNPAETIAEAYADVYCNGKKARRESREAVKVLEDILGGRI